MSSDVNFSGPFLGKGSRRKGTMPASKGTEWFVTLSTREEDGVDEKKVHDLVQLWPNYHVVKEFGKDHSHPHYHIVLWGVSTEQRQDVVRVRFRATLVDSDANPKGVVCVPVKSRDSLISSYLNKEGDRQILWSTLSDEEVNCLNSKVAADVANDKKKRKGKSVTLMSAPEDIMRFAERSQMPLTRRSELAPVVKAMMRAGFNMMGVLGRMKHIWISIEAVLDLPDFDDDFMSLMSGM